MKRTLFTLLLLASASFTQDFSGALSTIPWRISSVEPAQCKIGEAYWNVTAGAVKVCSATNTWSVFSGGGGSGASLSSQLLDFSASLAGSTVSVAVCSSSAPCNIGIGESVAAYSTPLTLTAPVGTGTALVWAVPSTGAIVAGFPASGFTATCAACTSTTTATQFPPGSFPLFTWSATSSVWDPTGYTNKRASYRVDKPWVITTTGSGPATYSPTATQNLLNIPTSSSGSGITADYKFNQSETLGSGAGTGAINITACAGVMCQCIFGVSSTSATAGGGILSIDYTNNETNQVAHTYNVTVTSSVSEVHAISLLLNSKAATTPTWQLFSGGAAGVYGMSVSCSIIN